MCKTYMRDGGADEIIIQDISNIPGTNCYLDDTAKGIIEDKYKEFGYKGIHILGSGNYHYLTYLWISKVCQDFSLLIFDNHPDMQKPAFEDILSCGSWALRASEKLKHLKRIYICGADENHIKEEAPYPDKVFFIENTEGLDEDLPIYLSIDKDVMDYKYAKTDWDQGKMTLKVLLENIEYLQKKNILGIDICGDTKSEPNGSDLNDKTNEILIPACLTLLKRSPLS